MFRGTMEGACVVASRSYSLFHSALRDSQKTQDTMPLRII